MHSHPRVVVIAGSIESIDALARFIRQMPATFPIPVVARLHGLQSRSIERLISKKWRFASHPNIVYAREGDHLQAGHVYVIPAEDGLVFVGVDVLGVTPDGAGSNADRLFASAAHWYQSEVIGVVLSGLGTDGTQGLRAITEVEGTRVVQSPNEAAFFSMPVSALRSNAVQYSVMLDQLGKLIMDLVAEPGPAETLSAEMIHEIALQTRASEEDRTKSLDHSIRDILNVMRQELAMDIVFIPKHEADGEIVDHEPARWDETSFHGVSHARTQRLCQDAFDGRRPMVRSEGVTSHRMDDEPATLTAPGSYMAMPVWHQSGFLFGTLCCLSPDVLPDLRRRHHQRLQMSARQIARLVDEPGGL
jgi:hypothetical protein